MNHPTSDNPRTLTFSQAQGYEDLPKSLKLEQVSRKARQEFWNVLYLYVSADHAEVNQSVATRYIKRSEWTGIFFELHTQFSLETADSFDPSNHVANLMQYRDDILGRMKFNKLFDMLQMIMRDPSCPSEVIRGVADVFLKERLAYVVDTGGPPTIIPAATQDEGRAIIAALHELRQGSLHAAVEHLRRASGAINEGDWGGSIRESIHAVESVARLLDPKAATTLGPALTSLEKQGGLHPALKKGFSNLYGYTSDEQGVRHSLLDDTDSPAGQDEAVFMLGACASFASYLWRRHQGGGQQ